MNKKAKIDLGTLMVIGIIAIVFIILSGGAGFSTLTGIFSTLAKIPIWVWIILIFIWIIGKIK